VPNNLAAMDISSIVPDMILISGNLLGVPATPQDFKDSSHQHGCSWWTTRDIGIDGKNRIDRANNVLIGCECAVLRLERCSPG
jgi:hypothetical protein